MQIKTTMRYHLTPVRMAKSTTNKQQVLARMLVGMQIGVATVESSMEITQKIKNGSALRPSNSTSGNLSEKA